MSGPVQPNRCSGLTTNIWLLTRALERFWSDSLLIVLMENEMNRELMHRNNRHTNSEEGCHRIEQVHKSYIVGDNKLNL